MEAIFGLMAVPLALLNLLSGLVAIVWLLLLGEWRMVAFGALYAFSSTFLIGVAMLPGMLFAGPAAMAAERGRTLLAVIIGFPALAWTYVLLFGSAFLFLSYAARVHDGFILPYLLWAYATALAPWANMARKEQQSGNEYSLYSVSGAQFGTMLAGIALLLDPTDYSFVRLGAWMAPGLLLAVLLQGIHMYAATREPDYSRY
jgi:hypothetical protein